ncbi:MAG: DNA repair protein RecN [Chlamydiae bacterium]|nr:DNA repair protein RecN [Chlamydiota bacterium]MBI3277926.1 DNA repair protein RecN [Chlamydiota bacterium]
MLKRLFIKNIALIEELEVEWGKGFNALTGETGAGKSITVGALLLILGEKASSDWVREGETRGWVEASFEVSNDSEIWGLLSEQGLETDSGELVIRREVSSDGKSRAFVSGSQVNISFLKSMGECLIDLHGQHAHQSLLKPHRQMEFVDLLGNLMDQRKKMKESYTRLQNLLEQKKGLEMIFQDREKQLDFLRYQEKEIKALNYQPSEEVALEDEAKILSHHERIKALVQSLENTLSESNPSLRDLFSKLVLDLKAIAEFDSSLIPEISSLENLHYAVDGIQSLIREKFRVMDYDPERLEFIEERLLEIQRLKKKYGDDLEKILLEIQEKLSSLERGEEKLEEISAAYKNEEKFYYENADRLTQQRKHQSQKLALGMVKELEVLGMKAARFEVRVEESRMIGPAGKDEICFYISTNAGESPKPLGEIASGGELSRVMLAMKALLSEKSFVPVLVFDEIDANLGGTSAHQVAHKLKDLSRNHQVIAITHLAQIAACADQHYGVEKVQSSKRVTIQIRSLNAQDRAREIARMLGGNQTSKIALTHAQELLSVGKK